MSEDELRAALAELVSSLRRGGSYYSHNDWTDGNDAGREAAADEIEGLLEA